MYNAKNGKNNHENIGLANICRQLLESFYHFKYPNESNPLSKMECKDKHLIKRYIHTGSHNTIVPDENHTPQKTPDDIIDIILENIKQMDKDHYDGMIEKINPPST